MLHVGETFTDHVQPYGTRTIRIDHIEINGAPAPAYSDAYGPQCVMTLSGTVLSGSETSFLFGHRSKRDIAGERHTVYGVRPRHWAAREKVSVAM